MFRKRTGYHAICICGHLRVIYGSTVGFVFFAVALTMVTTGIVGEGGLKMLHLHLNIFALTFFSLTK
jgi:hypothetical protein